MKRIIYITIISILLIFIGNSVQSIHDVWSKRHVLITTEQQLKKVQKENAALKIQLKTVSTQDFVEKEARNKLFLVKPGENTVFIAKDLLASNSGKLQSAPQESNWEQWMHLFF